MLKSRIYNFLILIFIIITSLFLYFYQIQETNAYVGLKHFVIDAMYILILTNSFILIMSLVIIIKSSLPSSYLVYIYILFVVISNVIFYKSTNILPYEEYLLCFILIISPLGCIVLFNNFFMLIIEKIFFKINIFKCFKIEYLLSLILLSTVIIIGLKMPLSFGLEDSYVRRLEGRELISGISAYLFASSMNSIAPFLAFYAFLKKKHIYFFISFFFVILCFGFIGSKAPIGYVIFLSFIGFIFRENQKINIFSFFLIILFFILLFSIIEYLIFDFSIIADIIIRRVFNVVAQIQSYFIDFIINNFTFENWIWGFESDKGITFLIGELYFNNSNTNANTNAFLYEFTSNGIFGYLLMIVFLSFFFSLLNFLYLKYDLKEVSGISIIYSLLLTEQAYTTAFITSGIGILTILVIITLENNRTYKEKNAK